jgi:tetratricopeptide (TPR) repeat protein
MSAKTPKKKRHTESTGHKATAPTGAVKAEQLKNSLKGPAREFRNHTDDHPKLYHFHLIVFCALIIIGTALYASTLSAPFLFDDTHNILESTWLKTPQKFFNHYFHKATFYKHRLIPFSTFALNWHLNQDDSFGYHLVNLAIHIFNSLLIYLITLKLLAIQPGERGQTRFAFLKLQAINYRERILLSSAVALLFLCHPIQTNVVIYIVQRIESLMAFFYLVSFYLFITAVQTSNNKLKKTASAIGCGVTFLLAVWSKEAAITFPLIAMVYYWTFVPHQGRIAPRKVALIIIAGGGIIGLAAYALFTSGVHTVFPHWSGPHATFSWGIKENLYTQANVILQYIKLLLIPLPGSLTIDHYFPVYTSIAQFPTYIAVFLNALVILFAVLKARQFPHLCFCILWWFIVLVPSSSIWPIWDIMVEYRVYLPGFGFYLLLTLCIHRIVAHFAQDRRGAIVNRGTITGVIFSLIVLLYVWGTYQRSSVWKDPLSLWMDAVQKAPTKARPHNNLGEQYSKMGRFDDAIAEYEKALNILPAFETARNNLGTAYTEKGMLDEAIQEYKKAIGLNPGYVKAFYNLGVAYLRAGKLDDAIAAYQRVIAINPDYAESHHNLGIAYAQAGKFENAIDSYRRALAIKSNYTRARTDLAMAYMKRGELDIAIAELKKVVANSPDYGEAYFNLGYAYAQRGNLSEAADAYKRAIDKGLSRADVHSNLGNLYFQQDRLEEAIDEYLQALALQKNFAGAHNNLAMAYFKKKDYPRAIQHCDRAQELGLSNPALLKDLMPYR